MNRTQPTVAARAAEAGFSLVEIMVVIVILGLLATMVVKNVAGISDEARLTKAQTDTKSIADQVRMYRAKVGKLPQSLEALTEKNDKGFSYLEELPKDPWGNDYTLMEGNGPQDWEVLSAGPDGSMNTEDDVSSKAKKDS
jgi:general secretion pathway protein G